MRIATKINAALISAFACGIAATYWVLETTIRPRFDEIERQAAYTNHKRVTDAFDSFTEKLQTATQDYAFWDETYAFMQGHNTDEYVASNLTPANKTVESLGVNALILLDRSHKVLWGAAYDLKSGDKLEGLVKEIVHFSKAHAYIGQSLPESSRGLIRTSMGPILVAIAPALRGDHSGPAVGKVISAKLLDVDAAKQLTGVDFTLESLGQLVDFAALPEAVALSAKANEIQTTSVLKNIVGRPLSLLKVSTARDVSTAGAMAIRSATLMMLAAALLALGVIWIFLHKNVVSRIEALRTHFATAGSSGMITQTKTTQSPDEMGDLARSFNGMADQVNHLRDALADSAYMTGLSEWAAGTLHNVRNGLAPVMASTWQVNQLLDKDWIKKIEVAAAEHADESTPADRRQKLNTYLIGSAERFAVAAKNTAELTTKIDEASKAVLDMVSEFESYSNRKVEIEPVNLLELIKNVSSITLQANQTTAEVVTPSTNAVVRGNGVILYQVFVNVLVNAIEATKNTQRRGKIEFSIDAAERDSDFTRIEIKDNGEGIAGGRLTEIFRRGVSSRSGRTGGVGLHWCANALKVLGGTIRAESDGPGLGATFVIIIPTFEAAKKEAA